MSWDCALRMPVMEDVPWAPEAAPCSTSISLPRLEPSRGSERARGLSKGEHMGSGRVPEKDCGVNSSVCISISCRHDSFQY